MPTPSGRESLMDAILAGQKPANFLAARPVDLVGDGVKSPVDGKFYSNRRDYEDHLKRNDCFVVGTDLDSKRQARREKIEERKEAGGKPKRKPSGTWTNYDG